MSHCRRRAGAPSTPQGAALPSSGCTGLRPSKPKRNVMGMSKAHGRFCTQRPPPTAKCCGVGGGGPTSPAQHPSFPSRDGTETKPASAWGWRAKQKTQGRGGMWLHGLYQFRSWKSKVHCTVLLSVSSLGARSATLHAVVAGTKELVKSCY